MLPLSSMDSYICLRVPSRVRTTIALGGWSLVI
uniref:Uncharacterized protein n=1 Tax=Anguilla anguilla TaxID=7936 RepID=A0A0E9PDC4_ANGAN